MPRLLGRKPTRVDARTLKFVHYAANLPAPPTKVAWSIHNSSYGMMLNDSISDCTEAMNGHLIQVWTSFTQPKPIVPSDPEILAAYERVSGYKPDDPSTDNGAVMLDVLNDFRANGVGGHKIAGYTSVRPTNFLQVRQATFLFGGLAIGLDLPEAAGDLIDAGEPWDVPRIPIGQRWQAGSWGGHAVPIVAYDPYWLTVITWGQLQGMSWKFLATYCSEAYACLSSQDWFTKSGKSPSGFDLAALQADLKAVTG